MINLWPLLAQTTPQEILESQYDVAVNMSQIFAGLRQEILTGQIFLVTSTLGAGIAALTAGWYFAEGSKSYSMDPEHFVFRSYLPVIFWIALVFLLLGNPVGRGSLLGRLVNSGAQLMDNVANFTLREASLNLNTDVIQAATIESQIEMIVDAGIARCAEISENQERDLCLIATQDQAQDLIDPFRNSNVVDVEGNEVGSDWANRIFLKTQDRIAAELNNANNYDHDSVVRTFTNASFPDVSFLIVGFLWLVASIFGYVQQVAVVVMATTSPIFLALSLSPLHKGAFAQWSVKFLNLGLFKVTFYLIASLAAWSSLLGDVDPNLFPLIVAICSLTYSWQILSGTASGLVYAPTGAAAAGGAIVRGVRGLIRR